LVFPANGIPRGCPGPASIGEPTFGYKVVAGVWVAISECQRVIKERSDTAGKNKKRQQKRQQVAGADVD
jgi:hypothetical protein